MENIEKNFNEKIIDKCVVDFWATWCGPCKMFGPIFEETSNEIDNINFYKFNVDLDELNVCKEYGIMSIPTVILFEDGKETRRNIGFMNKEDFKKFLGDK